MIAFDMDGTVLQKDSQITERLSRVLSRAAKEGIYIVPCTGRARSQMPETVEVLDFKYTITSNGGLLWDEIEGRELYSDCIPWEMAAAVYAEIEALGGVAFYHIHRHIYFQESRMPQVKPVYNPDHLAFIETVPDSVAHICQEQAGIEKIFVWIQDPVIRDQIRDRILQKYPLFCSCSSKDNLEFSMPGCSKGTALKHLCDHLKIDPAQVVAFGDGENDKEMLAFAGLGFAVAGAGPVCRGAADGVIGPCEEDSVAETLEKLL